MNLPTLYAMEHKTDAATTLASDTEWGKFCITTVTLFASAESAGPFGTLQALVPDMTHYINQVASLSEDDCEMAGKAMVCFVKTTEATLEFLRFLDGLSEETELTSESNVKYRNNLKKICDSAKKLVFTSLGRCCGSLAHH